MQMCALVTTSPPLYLLVQPLGVAPGSENWTIPESTSGEAPRRIVRNVVSPDYVPYIPDSARNTATGVVIPPGGGFVMLSIDSEGTEVANGLTRKSGDPDRPSRGRGGR